MGDENTEDVVMGFGISRAYESIPGILEDHSKRVDEMGIKPGWGVTRLTGSLDVDRIITRLHYSHHIQLWDAKLPRVDPLARVILFEIQSALISAEAALKAGRPSHTYGPRVSPDYMTVYSGRHGSVWYSIGYRRKLANFDFSVSVNVVGEEFDQPNDLSIIQYMYNYQQQEKNPDATL